MKRWNNSTTDELFGAILQLKTKAEAKRFLRDLLTEDELVEFGNRWLAARLLARGISYAKISARTRLSSTTIARVSKWLNKGMDGYKLILNRIANHHTHASPVRKGVVL